MKKLNRLEMRQHAKIASTSDIVLKNLADSTGISEVNVLSQSADVKRNQFLRRRLAGLFVVISALILFLFNNCSARVHYTHEAEPAAAPTPSASFRDPLGK